MHEAGAARGSETPSHSQFFEALRELNPLRIISLSGPSVFEAICDLSGFSIREGWLNAITEAYHWHLQLERVAHLTSRD